MKIGFLTCSAEKLKPYFPTLAEPDFIPTDPLITPDDQIAVNDLRALGFTLEPIVWGSNIHSLSDFDLVVVRSPWDYMDSEENQAQFMQWVEDLETAGVPLANPAHFMQWLLDKHYLKDLGTQGINIIPTQYYEKGAQLNLLDIFSRKGAFILKPCISAAGFGLFYIQSQTDALQFQDEVNQRIKNSSYMLQDFIPEITQNGEWSLIFLGGKYSHSVHKKPGPESILVHAERGGSVNFKQPPQHIIDFANQVYCAVSPAYTKATHKTCNPDLILYLRIDVIDTSSGPVVIECEGVEPELFFRAQVDSEKRFSQAIKRLLNGATSLL